MSVVDFVMELLFILFVFLMAMVGLMFAGAIIAGAFFVLVAFSGWIMTRFQGGLFT
ncbi:MAG: Uncharacterised protein [Methanobacteriota archaeon]|nr:MAG: Uncharacterised protein [Euryarchaeota archaeon]|tara:strand:- start:412 stop:579 length:168 start_codon:yes stop_codon:yes gene_type:complete